MKASWFVSVALLSTFIGMSPSWAVVEGSDSLGVRNCVMSVCYRTDTGSFVPVTTEDSADLVDKCLTQERTSQTRWWVADVQVSSESEALAYFRNQFSSPDYTFESIINGPISCRSFTEITPFETVEATTYSVDVEVKVEESVVPAKAENSQNPVLWMFGENKCEGEPIRVGPADSCEVIRDPSAKVTSIKVNGSCVEVGHQTAEYACINLRTGEAPQGSYTFYYDADCEGPTLYKRARQTCDEMRAEFGQGIIYWTNEDNQYFFVDSYRDPNGVCHSFSDALTPYEACLQLPE